MPVPTNGVISLTAIKNARSEDGTGGTSSNTYSTIRNGAVFSKFNSTYLDGATSLSEINKFSQWRGYPTGGPSFTYTMYYYNANSSSGTIGLHIRDSSEVIIWSALTNETSEPLSGSVPESIVEQIKNGGYTISYSVGGTFDELNFYIDGAYHSTKGTNVNSYSVVVSIPEFTNNRHTSFEVSTPGF